MLLLPVMVAVIVAACDGSTQATTSEPYANMPEGKPPLYGAPVPNPREVLETKAAGQLPDFLSTLDPTPRERTTAYYQGAVDNYEAFQRIPCYCGCAIYEKAHESLAQCYIKDIKENGEVVFTDHSLTCSQCQSAAKQTIEGIAAGKSLKDIRTEVHEAHKYTQVWTDTPAP